MWYLVRLLTLKEKPEWRITPYPSTGETVEILNEGQTIRDGSVLIGNIVVGDSGFTRAKNCTYAKIIEEATDIAQQMGGNMIYVISHNPPDFESTCHRINANVYNVTK